jgi:pimeloyl-ACP methyl ester carboxylesterase
VDFGAVASPVLVIAGGCDRIVPGRLARRTADRYRGATYVEIPGSDHMIFYGDALTITMGHIDYWIARNHVLARA